MALEWNGVWAIDPLRDDRWPHLVARHPKASVFHTRGWLEALKATYGYEPIAFTTSAPAGPLLDGLLFCKVRSWLTGHRLVSLPFSDHCEPLVEHPDGLRQLITHLESLQSQEKWKYIEMRSADSSLNGTGRLTSAETYSLHRLDLRPALDVLYRGLHKDCILRTIRRAERAALDYRAGRSALLLEQLYGLLQLTRIRHQLPPQPFMWFQNLVACLGDAVCIRIVSRAGHPVAGILTIGHGKKIVYKYGGSDAAFHNLGAMPFLLWQAIKESKETGAEELDLGRSDLDNPGLITFKGRWSAARSSLVTWRMPVAPASPFSETLKRQCAKQVFGRLPEGLLTLAGRLLYRHIG